ncbi:MAG: metal ABC transporter permease [Pseudomonadota bacterium]
MDFQFVTPFVEYEFMQRALVGSIAVCLGAVPTGVFMALRRMSLTGDAMAHAILPGAAVAYLVTGMSLVGLSFGGLVAGLIVAMLAGWVARITDSKEDSSLASFCIISLALGVLVISLKDSNIDLFHVLFGNILSLDNTALWLLSSICTISLFIFSWLFRPLVIECVDPQFLRRTSRSSSIAHLGFLFLMVLNLVAGFHALGTLMAIGIMILPAAAARFWARTIDGVLVTAILLGVICSYAGLVLSFNFDVPAGPAIVLSLGSTYVVSLFFGTNGGLVEKRLPRRHLTG